MGLPKVDHRPQIAGYHQYLERPSLEYQHAFDLCAVEVHHTGGAVAVFASSSFYARELLKRLTGCEAELLPTRSWSASSASFWELLGPEVEHPDVQTSGSLNSQMKVAVWAEPEREVDKQILIRLYDLLLPDGHLYTISSGWLSRFLLERRRDDDQPSEHPVGLWQTTRWLRQGGFTVKALYGFHSPLSILWGYAYRLMEHWGRSDLADRCLFQMRTKYMSKGQQALWAPVGMAVARKR